MTLFPGIRRHARATLLPVNNQFRTYSTEKNNRNNWKKMSFETQREIIQEKERLIVEKERLIQANESRCIYHLVMVCDVLT